MIVAIAIYLEIPFFKDLPYFLGYRISHSNYQDLEQALQDSNWEMADELTTEAIAELIHLGEESIFYPSQFHALPCADLRIMDQLWVDYSDGQYGFTVQRNIYQEVEGHTPEQPQWTSIQLAELEVMNSFVQAVGHDFINNTFNTSAIGYYPSFSVLMRSPDHSRFDGFTPFSTPDMVRRANWCRI